MIKLLFVDDEPPVLEALENRLRRYRRDWTLRFALGGAEALRIIDDEPFDVIVTDMRMPDVDGTDVLRHAKGEQPDAIRIVLSGQTEPEQLMRGLPLAHQMLSKPCEAEQLRAAVERAFALHSVLDNLELRRSLGNVDALPTIPGLYVELTEALERDAGSVEEIGRIVGRDAAVSARVLQLANSPVLGFRNHVEGIGNAVSRLGLQALRSIVLSASLFDPSWGPTRDAVGLAELGRHSELTGTLALSLARSLDLDHIAAFSAGILHDLGKLVLAIAAPDSFITALVAARMRGSSLLEAEVSVNGFTHADAGGYLLAMWGLPLSIVEGVAHHHQPSRAAPERRSVPAVVHVAEHLAREIVAPVEGLPLPELDMAVMEEMGFVERLPEWRQLAATLVTAPVGSS